MAASRGRHELEAAEAPLPALRTLRQRGQVRIVVPSELKVFARLRGRAVAGEQWRGMARDLSSRGVAVDLIEGGRFDPPHSGDEIVAELQHEGVVARVEGSVLRSSTREVAMRFRHGATYDDEVDTTLLGLLVQIAARRVQHLARPPGDPLGGRLRYQHFYGEGRLDVRVRLEPPAWWQISFLEHVISWDEQGGLSSGAVDANLAADADALVADPGTTRHERPWRSLCRLAVQVAAQCAAAHPEHHERFALIQRTAKTGMP